MVETIEKERRRWRKSHHKPNSALAATLMDRQHSLFKQTEGAVDDLVNQEQNMRNQNFAYVELDEDALTEIKKYIPRAHVAKHVHGRSYDLKGAQINGCTPLWLLNNTNRWVTLNNSTYDLFAAETNYLNQKNTKVVAHKFRYGTLFEKVPDDGTATGLVLRLFKGTIPVAQDESKTVGLLQGAMPAGHVEELKHIMTTFSDTTQELNDVMVKFATATRALANLIIKIEKK
jgi:hypothetical protein